MFSAFREKYLTLISINFENYCLIDQCFRHSTIHCPRKFFVYPEKYSSIFNHNFCMMWNQLVRICVMRWYCLPIIFSFFLQDWQMVVVPPWRLDHWRCYLYVTLYIVTLFLSAVGYLGYVTHYVRRCNNVGRRAQDAGYNFKNRV